MLFRPNTVGFFFLEVILKADQEICRSILRDLVDTICSDSESQKGDATAGIPPNAGVTSNQCGSATPQTTSGRYCFFLGLFIFDKV